MEWIYEPKFFDLDTSWKWVVSFTPWYPLDRKLGGTQSRSGRYGEVILDTTGTPNPGPSVTQPVASHYTDCVIPAPTIMVYRM
jgi:hypothetical protein